MMCHDEFEDTKGVIRIPKSKDRQCNGQKKKDKKTKGQTTIYNTLHIELKIE
jgi:hypothetical protein